MPDRITRKTGFTLIEVILVLVVIVILSAISLPHFSGSFRSNKLRTSARTISKMSRYARNMAIMREETLTIVLNPETMEIFLGGSSSATTNATDGKIDQDVLKRLGYKDGDTGAETAGIEKEIFRFLPDDLIVTKFDKDRMEADDDFDELHVIRFYPNGQCEWFELEIEDNRGTGIRMEIDPVSAKISSEFIQ